MRLILHKLQSINKTVVLRTLFLIIIKETQQHNSLRDRSTLFIYHWAKEWDIYFVWCGRQCKACNREESMSSQWVGLFTQHQREPTSHHNHHADNWTVGFPLCNFSLLITKQAIHTALRCNKQERFMLRISTSRCQFGATHAMMISTTTQESRVLSLSHLRIISCRRVCFSDEPPPTPNHCGEESTRFFLEIPPQINPMNWI